MKSLRLIIALSLFAFSGKIFSQGFPISVIVSNADCAVTVTGTYADSLTCASGTFQLLAADPSGSSFTGLIAINTFMTNYIVTVCATDCNGVINCNSGSIIPGTVTTFNIDMGNGGGAIDNDGDGFSSFADCNDNDANINANATEVCDGVDNNCNGTVDEGCSTGGCSTDIILVSDSVFASPYNVFIYFPVMNSAAANFIWSFGDGNTSTTMLPTWQYTSVGTYTACVTVAFPDGCTATDCVTFTVNADGSTNPGGINMQGFTLNVVSTMPISNSVSEISSTNDFMIFPNPVSESATIQWNATETEQGRFDIFNAQGQIVSSERYNVSAGAQQVQFNTQSLSAGMYIIRSVSNAGAVRQTTFVK
jgi:hypothetical protein